MSQIYGAWDSLKQSIVDQLDAFIGSPFEKDVCFCLNVFNGDDRVKTSTLDRTKSEDWMAWRETVDFGSLSQDPFFKGMDQTKFTVGDIQFDVLNTNQKAMKRAKRLEKFNQLFKLWIRLFAVAFGINVLVTTYALLESGDSCYSSKGDLVPYQFHD
mmetsp:Transcript_6640/g.10673  ORF Transcript_6640/g.10673 Transcript_6640/m.10673 type:complete len:157 (+) Transcript_6640:825-1295(+)|eukprot:CAMPEP_0170494962 /NCGR_PEP_ID=MMETSP0208-20121228/14940_1 /TAXON_ID=197538 /ORGANISM="Strombidium inclinatum, Strain S3" /LENGTH=156 /DNA_ID=CAMNT_0010771089 /DNA_START=825 /DNA_END=1295 /DNA_ORIENTATION=-